MRDQLQRYEPAQEREFHSTIPQHLLGKLSDSERYMVETMSKLENQWEWVRKTVLNQDRHTFGQDDEIQALNAMLDDRCEEIKTLKEQVRQLQEHKEEHKQALKILTEWKIMMTGKWAVVWAVGIVVLSVLLKYLLDLLVKKGP